MSSFARGFLTAWTGLRMALGNVDVRRAYLKIAAVVVSLTVLLDVVGLWLLWHRVWQDQVELGIGDILWRALATLMIFLLGPLLVVITMNIVFPVFNAIPFFAGLRQVAPNRAAELSSRPGLAFRQGVLVSIVRLARFLGWSLVAFAISFVPVVGPVLGTCLQLYVSALTLGWELLDPYFDKVGLTYGPQRAFVSRHRTGILGFGLPYAMVFAIPLVGPLCFGLAQAAAAMLVVDVLEPNEPRASATTRPA